MKIIVAQDDGTEVGTVSLPNVDTWTDDWQQDIEYEFAALVRKGIEACYGD